MALREYGSEGANLTINGIPIEEFGDTDPPITIEEIEQRSTLKRGIGGTSLRMDNQTRPKRVTVSIMPGSTESRQIKALDDAGVNITLRFSQSGSGEKFVCYDGVFTTQNSVGRGGKTTVSDDTFVFEFADSEET